MNAAEFTAALAEFAAKPAAEIEMTDGLEAIGIDSIGVFEFLMTIEDRTGGVQVEVSEDVETVQDLYDAVLDAVDAVAA